MRKRKIECLAFDLGRVIFDFDYKCALERMKDKIFSSPDEIIEALFYRNFALEFEKGNQSAYDFYLKFREVFSCSLDYDEFAKIWSEIFWPNYEVINLVERLSLLYSIYLISNINELHFNFLSQKFPDVFSLFDQLILSYKVNSVKPEKGIYEYLVRTSGKNPEDILYIDDREDLIEEAGKLKFRCIKFKDYHHLIEELRREKISIPDEREFATLKNLKEKIVSSSSVALLGVGNPLRGDDGVGSWLIQQLKGKVGLELIDGGVSPENYLSRLKKYSTLVIIDVGVFPGESKFVLKRVEDLQDLHLHLTHNLSLKFLAEYLKNSHSIDILILAIRGEDFRVGSSFSQQIEESIEMIEKFFMKNFLNSEEEKKCRGYL